MDDHSTRQLVHLNRHFYERHADSFAESRQAPWQGWQGVLEELQKQELPQPLGVLDAGSGEGRFLRYLVKNDIQLGGSVALDSSLGLLAAARRHHPKASPPPLWACVDLLDPDSHLPFEGQWGLVVAFGLLHHVPGAHLRQSLVRDLAELVQPEGLLVLTFWDYLRYRRFQSRVVPWEEYNRRSSEPLDLSQLEPGDTLLRWGESDSRVRYCHHVSERELDHLIDLLPLTLLARYTSDGKTNDLNRYVIFKRPSHCIP